QHPEPRGKFPPRFPDGTFDAVRASIGPMALGLWMSPLHFNPAAQTFASHPQWACHPISDGLVLYNAAQPDDGSNEAGIGEWSTAGFPWVESRTEDAMDTGASATSSSTSCSGSTARARTTSIRTTTRSSR